MVWCEGGREGSVRRFRLCILLSELECPLRTILNTENKKNLDRQCLNAINIDVTIHLATFCISPPSTPFPLSIRPALPSHVLAL